MNPEIENLINMALADGDVSDKERAIILRKAKSIGLDKDEVELILDGKITLLKNEQSLTIGTKSSKSNTEGDVKKCPACGAAVQSFTINCRDCGHEFRNTKTNSRIIHLIERLEAIERTYLPNSSNQMLDYQKQKEMCRTQSKIIKNFPIPNNKEDILEFLSLGISKSTTVSIGDSLNDSEASNTDAWRQKSKEVLFKAKILFNADKYFTNELQRYESDLQKSIKSANRIPIIIYLSIFIFVLLIIISAIIWG
jgi:hypothetical protein